MEWFTTLEPPTQVAIIGVLTALIAAVVTVSVAIINNRKEGGGKAEIAAFTIDPTAVNNVASSISKLTKALEDQTKTSGEGGEDLIQALKQVSRELEEVRRELRAVSDKMRQR